MHFPETAPRGQGFLHRCSARLKLGGTLALVAAVALMPRRPDLLYLAPAGILLALWAFTRMSLSYVWRRMLMLECLIFGIALLSLFTPSAAPVLISTIIKSNLCVFAMLLLTWTTPFHEILLELRRLRLPAVMLTTLALMYRYLPLLIEESRRMERARASRTFSRRRRVAWHNLADLIGRLFIRSADRAERIYLAMCARGWK